MDIKEKTIATLLILHLSCTYGVYHQHDNIEEQLILNPMQYGNQVAIPDLPQPGLNVTIECLAEWLIFLRDFNKHENIHSYPYVFDVLDSYGKPESGVRQGKLKWLGHYSLCTNSHSVKKDSGFMFEGKYCVAKLKIWEDKNNSKRSFTPSTGVCVSRSCQVSDLPKIINPVLKLINRLGNDSSDFEVLEEGTYCTGKPDIEFGTILCIVILGFLIFMSICGSLLDVMIQTSQHLDGIVESRFKKRVKGTVADIFLCWSWYTNGLKLITPGKKTADSLDAVNGIRSISMWVVVFGHTYYFMGGTAGNIVAFYDMQRRFDFQAMLSGPLAVDTFFFLSGMLVAYSIFKQLKKTSVRRFAWVLYYFHRIWRLTPAYMFVLLFYSTLFLQILKGPYMNNLERQPTMTNCWHLWWTNLLYINNFYPGTMAEQCLGWSWYLAVDMQFYIVSPIFIIVFYYNWKIGLAFISSVCVALMVLTGVMSYQWDYTPIDFRDPFQKIEGNSQLYVQPWYRMAPYLVGFVTGWFIVHSNRTMKLSKAVVIVLWIISGIIMLANVYGLYTYYHNYEFAFSPAGDSLPGKEMPRGLAAFHTACHRFGWAIALSWMTLACVTGNGGVIDMLLSWKVWSPVGRLTYCAYLIHPVVIQCYYLNREQVFFLDDYLAIYLFFSHLIATYIVAFYLSMLVEAPMMALEKIMFRRRAPRRKLQRQESTAQELDEERPEGPLEPPPYTETEMETTSEKSKRCVSFSNVGYENENRLDNTAWERPRLSSRAVVETF